MKTVQQQLCTGEGSLLPRDGMYLKLIALRWLGICVYHLGKPNIENIERNLKVRIAIGFIKEICFLILYSKIVSSG